MKEPMVVIDGSYGGDQRWFPRKRQQVTGCGAVAASNILAALAAARGSRWGPLAPDGAASRETFLSLMEDLYRRLRPGLLGLWSPRKWTRTVLAWAQEHGVPLTARYCSFRESPETCRAFLASYLDRGLPVAALSLRTGLPHKAPYDWHWITVTGLEGDRMIFSSWGQRRTESWSDYYHRASTALWKGGLVAFEEAHPL